MLGFKEEAKTLKPATLKKLETEVINHANFSFEKAQTSSYAIQFLYNWVKAMFDFNREYVRAGPLRQQMEDMRKIVEEKEAELKEKKAHLAQINSKIEELESMYRQKVAQ